MKKIIYIIFTISLFHNYTAAQWIIQNSGTTDHLYDVYFINAQTGWACGNNGTLLKTTNRGNNWVNINSIVTESVQSIHFVNENTGWIGTRYNGKIYKSTNGGINWFQQVYSDNHAFNSIFFANEINGWVTSSGNGGVFFTTNGGDNWDSIYIATGAGSDIEFINLNTGWIIIGSKIYKTENSGLNWSLQFDNIGNGEMQSLSFINLNTGYAVSLETWRVYKTTNGGSNWFLRNILPDCFNTHCIYFINENTGWVSGDCGQMFSTTNGGLNWFQQQTNTNSFLKSTVFINDSIGGAVGGGGIIINTTTGGAIVGLEPVSNSIPREFKLYQNYPNPFNPVTLIKYDLPKEVNVTIKIYDLLGREVATLVNNELKKAGRYELNWNAGNYASGVFFYRIEAGSYVNSKKMVLVK